MKKRIALVTGGYSGEAQISYKSAVTVEQNVDKEKFDVYKIDICKEGWLYDDGNGNRTPVDLNDFTITVNGKKINFDVALMCIHGNPGEDGKLQGYFDMLRIPYTSCDAATSALTFNKRCTVAVAAFSGIRVSRSVLLIKNRFTNPEEIINNLQFPVFVKPNNGGSSIGMSKVNKASEELGAAIEKAFNEDDQVLVEEFIEGRELTIGVFRKNNEIITLPMTEIISKKEFFDFYEEYINREFKKKENQSSGGDFYATTRKRLSMTFAAHVNNAVKSGNLLYREAYKLTSLRGDTYQNFFNKHF